MDHKNGMAVIHSISKVSNHLRRRFDAISFGPGYTAAEGRTLRFILLNREKELYQKDIEDEYALRAATVSQLLAKMEKDGLIVRHYDSSDSRLKRISPSETAAAFAPSVEQSFEELEKGIIDGIDEADLEVFLRVINKMAHNIEQ